MKKKGENKEIRNKTYKFENFFYDYPRTLGQKASDGLAKWAGSWVFIISFFIFLGVWIGTNGVFILKLIGGELIDPYPFILLNLALSCLAAIQAPIILMSQNRQAQKDRSRAQYDYAVNKKAEKEILEILKQLNKIERMMGRKDKK